MLILRAQIALNAAVICFILFIISLIIKLGLLRNVGFYRSFQQNEFHEIKVTEGGISFLEGESKTQQINTPSNWTG